MSSSADEVDAAIGHAVEAIEAAVQQVPADPLPIVVIDGRSGAGKSTVARRLRERWPGAVCVVGLDEFYPGWDGLAAASRMTFESLVRPLSMGRAARWHRWDWVNDRPGDAVITAPGTALIVEGVGALTRETASLATVSVWLDSPADARRERALARDGDAYRPHWSRWAAQEDEHIRVHQPQSLATLVLAVP